MTLTKLERQDAVASSEGSDLIRLYEAVADLLQFARTRSTNLVAMR